MGCETCSVVLSLNFNQQQTERLQAELEAITGKDPEKEVALEEQIRFHQTESANTTAKMLGKCGECPKCTIT